MTARPQLGVSLKHGMVRLLHVQGDKKDQYRGFGDFFPLQTENFQKRLKVISTEEFIRREGGPDGRLPLPEANKTKILNAVKHCQFRAKSKIDSTTVVRRRQEESAQQQFQDVGYQMTARYIYMLTSFLVLSMLCRR